MDSNTIKGPYDISFHWPFKIVLCGVSGSGKTKFVHNLIDKISMVSTEIPDKIIFVYKEEQDIYKSINSSFFNIEFIKDIDNDFTEKVLSESKDGKKLMVVLDDQYYSKNLAVIGELYLVTARHRSISVIFLTQSIFNNPNLKNISRNSSHIILFKNIRLQEPYTLFSQFFPGKNRSLPLKNLYDTLMSEDYSYLLIDCTVNCLPFLRFRSDIFKRVVRIFLINMATFKTMYLIDEKLKKKVEENISLDVPFNNTKNEKTFEKSISTIQDNNETEHHDEKRMKDEYVPNSNPTDQYSLIKPVELNSEQVKPEVVKKRTKKRRLDYSDYFKNTNSPIIQTLKSDNTRQVYKPY